MKKEILFNSLAGIILPPVAALGGQFEQDNKISTQPAIPQNQIVLETKLPSEELFNQIVKIQNGEQERNFLNHPDIWQKAAVSVGVVGFAILLTALSRRQMPGSTQQHGILSELQEIKLGLFLIWGSVGVGLYNLWK